MRKAPCIAFLLATVACQRLETIDNVYPNAQAAIQAGAITQGWLPEFLPTAAEHIHERHNIDTGEIWVKFSAPKSELESINKQCRLVGSNEIVFPRAMGAGWWPEPLTSSWKNIQTQAETYTYHLCARGGSIAIEENSYTVFYWR